MHTPKTAARLIYEMDEVHAYWEELQRVDPEQMPLVAATVLMVIPEGLERLRRAWILDRLDGELATKKTPAGV